jgi:hypothetical protein
MRGKRAIGTMAVAAALVFGVMAVAASPQDQPAPAGGEAKQKPPTLKAPLANMWKRPGLTPEHEILSGLVGKATTAVHVTQGPYPRLTDTKGTAEGTSVMGGLFVQVSQSDTRMQAPFERTVFFGYDPSIRKYTADAFDTTSAAAVRYLGTFDAGKKQLTLSSRHTDPNTKRYVSARMVATFVDAKTWTCDDYLAPGPNEPEVQTASVTFKRP